MMQKAFVTSGNVTTSRRSDLALASKIAGDRMMAAFDRLCRLVAKEGFNPEQPRVPAGSPNGGQWQEAIQPPVLERLLIRFNP